jgi:hypothetical protein
VAKYAATWLIHTHTLETIMMKKILGALLCTIALWSCGGGLAEVEVDGVLRCEL